MGTVDLDDADIVGRRKSPKEVLRESLITGAAIILPLAVTLLVLSFVVNFLSSNLRPFSSQIVKYVPLKEVLVVEFVTVLALVGVTLVIGFVAEFTESGGTLGDQFDRFMASIPGLGSVYTSFNEMSDLLLDSDTDSFQDVKLVEYPGERSYTVAFKTAETPEVLEEDTGHPDMVTLFMPMAPNPVMGGFVIHVSTERVVDTNLTVEEGLRSIVTSGVAVGEEAPEMRGLSREQMEELARLRRVEDGSQPESTGGVAATTRREDYDSAVDAEHSDTPRDIERRADRGTADTTTPTDIERGDGAIGDTTGRPTESRRRDERTRGTTPDRPEEMGSRDTGRSAAPVDTRGTGRNDHGARTDSGDRAGGSEGPAGGPEGADGGGGGEEAGDGTEPTDWIPDEFVGEGDGTDGDGADGGSGADGADGEGEAE